MATSGSGEGEDDKKAAEGETERWRMECGRVQWLRATTDSGEGFLFIPSPLPSAGRVHPSSSA